MTLLRFIKVWLDPGSVGKSARLASIGSTVNPRRVAACWRLASIRTTINPWGSAATDWGLRVEFALVIICLMSQA